MLRRGSSPSGDAGGGVPHSTGGCRYRYWQPESIESLHSKLLKVDQAVHRASDTINHLSGKDVVTPRIIVFFSLLLIFYALYKDTFYEWLGREVCAAAVYLLCLLLTTISLLSAQAAEVASHSISDERTVESIRKTIILVAESPEAVESVTTLLKSVLALPETRDAFSGLMARVLSTEWMQEVGVYYFLSVINDESVTNWMNERAVETVRDTMADPRVQQSTGEGVSVSTPFASVCRCRRLNGFCITGLACIRVWVHPPAGAWLRKRDGESGSAWESPDGAANACAGHQGIAKSRAVTAPCALCEPVHGDPNNGVSPRN